MSGDKMRIWAASFIAIALVLGACSRTDRRTDVRRDDHSAANEVGRAAYHLSQETKKAAAKAAHELNKAGKQAHEGWNEAKRESHDKGK